MDLNQDALSIESPEFSLLKPLCNSVLRNPNVKNLKSLSEALNNTEVLEDKITEYVIFPVAVHLKFIGKFSEVERTTLFVCLKTILEKCTVKSFDTFAEIFQRLNIALVPVDNPTSLNSNLSEEELDAVTSCTMALLKRSLPIHSNALYSEKRIKIVGFFIFIILELINHDTIVKIRLCALDILSTLVECDYNGDSSASNRLFNFFPGIISSLRKSCSTNKGRVYKRIILKSLQVMAKTIKICVSNIECEKLIQPDHNLTQVIDIISKEFLTRDEAHYRSALLDFSIDLISTLENKLPGCLEVLKINVLVLRMDEESRISEKAQSFLQNAGESGFQFCTFDYTIKLTKQSIGVLRRNDELSCLLTLRQVAAILTVRKINFAELRTFYPVLFSLASQCLPLKKFTPHGKHEVHPVLSICAAVCQNILLAASLDDILDELISNLAELNPEFEKQSSTNGMLFCFNEFLRSYINISTKSDFTLERTIDCYEVVNLANMYIAQLDSETTEVVIMAEAEKQPNMQTQSEVRKVLLVEGISVLTQINPSYVLPSSLYSLIENAGTKDSVIISNAALRSLQDIAERTPKANTVPLLLTSNIDLIMGELNVRISNLSLNPNCPNVLIFLSAYFDFSASDFVELVEQIFEKSCDEFNGGYMQLIYAKIFFAFISSLCANQTIKPLNLTIVSDKVKARSKNVSNNLNLYQRLVDYQTAVGIELEDDLQKSEKNEISDKELGDEDDDTKTATTEENDDETKLSSSQSLVHRITRRALNFLPNEERTVRLIAMDCLIKGVFLLQDSENTLLPLAHTIWQNLVPRLMEKDYVVVRKSFELILALSTTCGSFLKKRVLEEVFPKLANLLFTLAEESLRVKNKFRQYYTYTQGYKLQLTVLQGMSQMCESLEIQEQDLHKVVEGAILYTNPQQHKNLQDAAHKLLDCIAGSPNCRSIWLLLVANGLKDIPEQRDPSFLVIPPNLKVKRFKKN